MSTLVNRNIFINRRRTSMRLEPTFWALLDEIAALENRTIHDVCSGVAATKGDGGLTTAVRIYIVSFWRAKATQ